MYHNCLSSQRHNFVEEVLSNTIFITGMGSKSMFAQDAMEEASVNTSECVPLVHFAKGPLFVRMANTNILARPAPTTNTFVSMAASRGFVHSAAGSLCVLTADLNTGAQIFSRL